MLQQIVRKSWFIALFFIYFFSSFVFAQKISTLTTRLLNPVTGKGTLELTVESFKGNSIKVQSQLADRAELWLGDRRLATIRADSPNVEKHKTNRIFKFPPMQFENGYYFFTVRLYLEGWISNRRKWKGQTFQIGIHAGKTSRIHKRIPFIIW